PWETRVALLEDTTLVELHIERRGGGGIAGNVYKGKVLRVLPGMQAAFIDIGLPKAAFLHASDVVPRRCRPRWRARATRPSWSRRRRSPRRTTHVRSRSACTRARRCWSRWRRSRWGPRARA